MLENSQVNSAKWSWKINPFISLEGKFGKSHLSRQETGVRREWETEFLTREDLAEPGEGSGGRAEQRGSYRKNRRRSCPTHVLRSPDSFRSCSLLSSFTVLVMMIPESRTGLGPELGFESGHQAFVK